jgi:hypothetical protein
MERVMGRTSRTFGTLGLAFAMALITVACSWGASTTTGAKSAANNTRNREIVHQPCDVEASSAEKIDANGDGKPDVTIVSEGGKEQCRASDLDFDGRVDLYSYLDPSGKLTRRELDYDRDGAIDEIQIFKDGIIAEKHRATTLSKRLDTWETYEQGKLVKAERDADGNGRIDQWWEYKTLECPIIRTDSDGNGEPDPTSQVDFCSEAGYKPPEPVTPTTQPMLQKDTQALPTETSNQPEGENSDAPKTDAPTKESGSPSTPPEKASGNAASKETGSPSTQPTKKAGSDKGKPNEK